MAALQTIARPQAARRVFFPIAEIVQAWGLPYPVHLGDGKPSPYIACRYRAIGARRSVLTEDSIGGYSIFLWRV